MVQPLDWRLMTEATFYGKASEQDATLAHQTARIESIETLGGLAPGDVSDATVKSLVSQPNSGAREALDAAFIGRGETAVNAKTAGAKGDGTTDDRPALAGLFSAVATFGIRKVTVPVGTYRITAPLELSAFDTEIIFEAGATLSLDSATFTDRPLTISGGRNRIVGGKFTSPTRRKFLLSITGDDNTVTGAVVAHAAKSTMAVVPGTSIYYNQGGVEVRGSRNTVERTETANTEGAGIYLYGDGNKAVRCYTHDNCTGVLVSGNNASILDCTIVDNNVNKAEGYDGILATSDGLTVRGNLVTGSGEHGMYLHGANITVSGNTVRGNYFNGIKAGNVDGVSIVGNTLDSNNTSLSASESQIYVQQSFKRVTVTGNTETARLAGTFIRVWSSLTTDESVTIVGNAGIGDISANAAKNVVIEANITAGNIMLGYADSSYPLLTGAIVAGNVANRITYAQCTRPSISGNVVASITSAGSGTPAAIIKGNDITAQDVMIPLRAVKEFSGNTVVFTMTTNTDTLFQQDATKRAGMRFVNNDFTSSGGRFLFFTSEGASPDNLTIIGNSFKGVLQPLYFWGTGHQIIGNRADQQMGFLGVSNSIITGNIKEPGLRAGYTGNVVANNIA